MSDEPPPGGPPEASLEAPSEAVPEATPPLERVVPWRLLGFLGSSLVLWGLAQQGILVALLLLRGDGGRLFERLRFLLQNPDGPLILAAAALSSPVLIAWTFLWRTRIDRRPLVSIGFAGRSWRPFAAGWIIGFALPALLLGIGLLAGAYAPIEGAGPRLVEGLPVMMLALLGFVVQAAGEEIVTRGYLQTTFGEWLHPRGLARPLALILPSVFFAALHAGNPGFGAMAFFNTFLIGVTLGAWVLRLGSLWGAMGFHAGWNFGLGAFWSLPVSGLSVYEALPIALTERGRDPLVFGGSYGPESGLVITALTFFALAWAVPRR